MGMKEKRKARPKYLHIGKTKKHTGKVIDPRTLSLTSTYLSLSVYIKSPTLASWPWFPI